MQRNFTDQLTDLRAPDSEPTERLADTTPATQADFDHALATWRKEDRIAATAEGWSLEITRAAHPEIQCQKIDDSSSEEDREGCIAELDSDNQAHRILFSGIEPHHARARRILQRYSPREWNLISSAAISADVAPTT